MLEGKRVNLRVVEKEDLPLVAEYENNPEFWGELAVYPLLQKSKVDFEKEYDKRPPEENWFFIEKKMEPELVQYFTFLRESS